MRKLAFWQTSSVLLGTLFIVLTYQACGEFHSNPRALQEEVLNSLSCDHKLAWSFEMGMHKFLIRNCSSCHSQFSGASAPGNFADKDPQVAFADFAGLGYGTTPTKWSLVIRNATDDLTNHQGQGGSHHLGAFTPAKELWELGLANYDKYCGEVTEAHLTEAIRWVTGQAPNAFEARSIPLDELSGNISIPGGELKFQASYNNVGVPLTYTMKELRMKNGDRRVRVKSISVYHNGVLMPSATTYKLVDTTLEPGEEVPLVIPGTSPPYSPLYVEAPGGGDHETDEVSLEFGSIEFL